MYHEYADSSYKAFCLLFESVRYQESTVNKDTRPNSWLKPCKHNTLLQLINLALEEPQITSTDQERFNLFKQNKRSKTCFKSI